MPSSYFSRRNFVKAVGALAGGSFISQTVGCKQPAVSPPKEAALQAGSAVDYTLTIAVKPVELAPNRIVSTTTYNGQFPGPLLRFKEGKQVTIEINNQTDTPEQLHWHGQFLSTDVDGAAEDARRSFRRMEGAASPSSQSLPGFASTTPTFVREQI